MHKIIFLFVLLILAVSYHLISNQENTKAKQDCYCETDQYNCADFQSNKEAQMIYDCCLDKTGYDVHGLDGDDDKRVCEW
ncbi:hypothetical protein L6274_01040 [Candidatus Parcubacteria bacterium]|nr:hypothetical protein [Candidatus Parcubacteria bacterium]MCG2809389.1 hypothetical protein [Candidatus Portnoybacteria bacterium]